MSWNKYGSVKTLAPTFELEVACSRAGIPLLIVAPPSGGKTTTIFACEKWLSEHGEPTRRVSRIGLRALKQLADWLKESQYATLLNEDYALLGSSEHMAEKMGEIVGALSYSRSYQDDGLKVNLNMVRLGFVSGVQPLWIKTMMVHPVFATHVREKFIRYYDLPYMPSESVPMLEAIDLLNVKLKERKVNVNIRIPPQFVRALSIQVGSERAKEYAPKIERELSTLMPSNRVYPALMFYAERIGFERDFVEREIEENGFKVETKWCGFHALYWCLRKGQVTREEFMDLLGVTSLRSVERALENAIRYGWVTSEWNSTKKVFMASKPILERVKLI
jgi:hypothetical protein